MLEVSSKPVRERRGCSQLGVEQAVIAHACHGHTFQLLAGLSV